MTKLLTAEWLRAHYLYDPETGCITRIAGGRGATMGRVVGQAVSTDGYRTMSIFNVTRRIHRIAFLYMTGEWPRHQVDHINGDRSDNRWANLRDVTPIENSQNARKARPTNKSCGVLGVTHNGTRFIAQITADGRHRYLGSFDSAEQAHNAYVTAKRQLHSANTL